MVADPPSPSMGGPVAARAGAEDAAEPAGFDPRPDDFAAPSEPSRLVPDPAELRDLRALLPTSDEERSLDDWGRSERFV